MRSVIVSPIASSAGHIAGGTTYNLIGGQNFADAFSNSFNGIGQSIAVGTATGVVSTIAVSYANGINPFNGNYLDFKFKLIDYEDNLRIYEVRNGGRKFMIGGDMKIDGNRLTINNFDIDGSYTNQLGIKGVRAMTNSLESI